MLNTKIFLKFCARTLIKYDEVIRMLFINVKNIGKYTNRPERLSYMLELPQEF